MEVNHWDRCWKENDEWVTDFPPPPGFDGWQQGEWPSRNYQRACTPEEAEILNASEAAADAEELSEAEKLRDDWFALLRSGTEPAEAAISVTRKAQLAVPVPEIGPRPPQRPLLR